MGYARVRAVGLVGMRGHLIEVEADLATGLPGVVVSGLPDTALRQARDRVRAAVVNSREPWPTRRITVNLRPAALPKYGTGFDTAIALAVLGADGVVPLAPLAGTVVFGELGLDGQVRPVRGILPAVLAAAHAGVSRVVVPYDCLREARLVPDVQVVGVATLRQLVDFLRGQGALDDVPDEPPASPVATGGDLGEVVGQEHGRRALEVAAAGGHHLALLGPPGSGKTMLAERLPSLLPPLAVGPALEVTALHSVAGTLDADHTLQRRPPYQAPHHTASVAALVGGGSGVPRPGAVSLAHRGVLFMDEAPEFVSAALDALREPLERGEIVLARSGGIVQYPAKFQLILAANPCPCAKPAGDLACTCTPMARRRYLGRLSGPLLDRVDVQVELLPVRSAALLAEEDNAEASEVVAARVRAAREAAVARWAGDGGAWRANAEVPGPALRSSRWRLPRLVTRSADKQIDIGVLSARGYDRVLRIAWTLADLGGRQRPDAGDVNEATMLRTRRMA